MNQRDDSREEGTVKWFHAGKGYGFIARDGAVDVWFHASEVAEDEADGPLQRGERVRFTVEEGARGLRATKVVRAVAEV